MLLTEWITSKHNQFYSYKVFKVKHIKNKLIPSGYSAEEADLLINNMYYLIKILIENLDKNNKSNDN